MPDRLVDGTIAGVAIEIRRIAEGEGRHLRDVRLRALRDSPGAFSSTFEDFEKRPLSEWRDAAAARSAGNDETTFVAASPTEFVGMVGGYRSDQRAGVVELTSMWVDPSARGSGVGVRLIEAVVAWARAGGADRVDLWVVEENDPAMALYKRVGFTVTSDREPYPNHPCQDEMRMTLAITPA